MKLHLTTAENNNLITAYDKGFFEINRQRYQQNLIVTPQQIITDWQAMDFANLNNSQFQCVVNLKPEVVILGTGEKHQFLHPKHYQCLTEKGISLECMSSAAACRTYNILMSEGRSVAVALIL